MAAIDLMQQWAEAVGIVIRERTVIVEGTSDVEMFALAARLFRASTGANLLDDRIAITAGGEGTDGGTTGVLRKLHAGRELSRACLLPNGRAKYRFIALFDNDRAGRQAIRAAKDLDRNLLEYRDVFRLWPMMPKFGSLDVRSLQLATESANDGFKGLEWELEDLLHDSFLDAFLSDEPTAVASSFSAGGRVHRNYSRDGKSRLHRFVKNHAMLPDVAGVVDVLFALRFYLGLPNLQS